MKLGIKVGPQGSSRDDLERTHPACAEVWFNIGQEDAYQELFAYLTARDIEVGLHFWGLTTGNINANLAYPDLQLASESMRLIKKTIALAAKHKFDYVNIHPGGRAKIRIDFDASSFEPVTDLVTPQVSKNLFFEHIFDLDAYARNSGIILTVETVPATAPRLFGLMDRSDIVNCGELPAKVLVEAAHRGIWIANDFGHTAAIVGRTPAAIWRHTKTITAALASQTKLIHLGYVVPPYNGSDFHDMLDNPLLDTDQAIPNKQQMVELLKMFQHQNGWIITEPRADHVTNYFLAQKLLAESSLIFKPV